MAEPFDDSDEKALDPAVERVRRKLLRFVAVNLGILFAAVIIVVAAVVYRSVGSDQRPAADSAIGVPTGEVLEAEIAVPAGARIVSQSLSGSRVALDLELAGGERSILIYDLAERRVVARLAIRPQ